MRKKEDKKKFLVPSDLSAVPATSRKVLSFLKPLSLGEGDLFDIRLCLEEALINAIKYGNEFREDLTAEVTAVFGPDEVSIQVTDKGKGYDAAKLDDCTQNKNLLRNRGRGIYLIHQLMDKVKYNSKGNSILMVKSLKSKKGLVHKK